MQTLIQFKKEYKKRETRVRVENITYWCSTIDDTIKEFQKIKKQFRGHVVEIELEYGHYDDEYPSISFFIRRKETDEEFNRRVQQAYDCHVHNEKYELKIYEKIKKKFEE